MGPDDSPQVAADLRVYLKQWVMQGTLSTPSTPIQG